MRKLKRLNMNSYAIDNSYNQEKIIEKKFQDKSLGFEYLHSSEKIQLVNSQKLLFFMRQNMI